MPLAPGARLGPYEVVSLLGAGGMGEVYRARDGRLHRDVAIKILPASVAQDAPSRARFEREAQAVAALSHPNVLAIFDVGTEQGHLFVVTELLDGETLRRRLLQGPLPARRAIDWAAGIARGLAAAHDKQVVHRDLKPENLFLTTDGRVKILDFGLAKAPVTTVSGASDAAADTVAAITGEGMVLGTVGYMAPEQIRGQAVDGRADVFALGAVFYEMLTGRRAFQRETAADTMTAILQDEPLELGPARTDLPPGLDRVIRHCLEKSPKERFQSAQDVAFALDTLSGAGMAGAHVTAPAGRRSPAALAGLAAGLLLLAAVLWWGATQWGSDRTPAAIALGAATQVTADDGLEIDAALSPDGQLLAYSAGQARQMRIFIRPVTGGRVLTLSESETAFEYQPRWSPDGSQILFLRPDGVFVASSLGGTVRQVASGSFAGAAWSPDGARVLLVRPTTLSVVALAGGAETPLATGGAELHSCAWSPATEWIACASGNALAIVPGRGFGNVAPSALVVAPATGGAFITIADRDGLHASPAWSPDGRELYFVSSREGPRDVYVMGIGARGATGAARRVTTGLGVHSIAFAATGGRLAYVTSQMRANIWSLPIPSSAPTDLTGAQPVTNGTQVVEAMTVSPDRRWLLFDTTLHLNAEILRMPLAGGPLERLTTDPADDFAPSLSPDGRLLAFHSWRTGSRDIFVQPLDGAAVQQLTHTPAQESYPLWSPDGRAILFVSQRGHRDEVVHGDLFLMRRGDAGGWSEPVPVATSVATHGAWLRRGTTDVLAFVREGGIVLIWPESGAEQTIYAPARDASQPLAWSLAASEDSSTLYFKSGSAAGQTTFWSIPAGGGTPRLLVRFTDPNRQSLRADFAAGGGRFFFTIEDRQADVWVAEVSRR